MTEKREEKSEAETNTNDSAKSAVAENSEAKSSDADKKVSAVITTEKTSSVRLSAAAEETTKVRKSVTFGNRYVKLRQSIDIPNRDQLRESKEREYDLIGNSFPTTTKFDILRAEWEYGEPDKDGFRGTKRIRPYEVYLELDEEEIKRLNDDAGNGEINTCSDIGKLVEGYVGHQELQQELSLQSDKWYSVSEQEMQSKSAGDHRYFARFENIATVLDFWRNVIDDPLHLYKGMPPATHRPDLMNERNKFITEKGSKVVHFKQSYVEPKDRKFADGSENKFIYMARIEFEEVIRPTDKDREILDAESKEGLQAKFTELKINAKESRQPRAAK
jgi:hypothetical protein